MQQLASALVIPRHDGRKDAVWLKRTDEAQRRLLDLEKLARTAYVHGHQPLPRWADDREYMWDVLEIPGLEDFDHISPEERARILKGPSSKSATNTPIGVYVPIPHEPEQKFDKTQYLKHQPAAARRPPREQPTPQRPDQFPASEVEHALTTEAERIPIPHDLFRVLPHYWHTGSPPTGHVSFNEHARFFAALGWAVAPIGGSRYVFSSPAGQRLVFHAPHGQGPRLRDDVLKGMGRTMTRVLGWTKDCFVEGD